MWRTASKENNFGFLFLNSKSITSWAQKLKQNQPKRALTEEGCSKSMQGDEQAKKSPGEKVGDKSLYSGTLQLLIIMWRVPHAHQHEFFALSLVVLICSIDLSSFGCLRGLETMICSKHWFFSSLEIRTKEEWSTVKSENHFVKVLILFILQLFTFS